MSATIEIGDWIVYPSGRAATPFAYAHREFDARAGDHRAGLATSLDEARERIANLEALIDPGEASVGDAAAAALIWGLIVAVLIIAMAIGR